MATPYRRLGFSHGSRRLGIEPLESRVVLASDLAGGALLAYDAVSPAWFAEVTPAAEDMGVSADRFIIRLTPDAAAEAVTAAGAADYLGDLPLEVIRGLGKPGQLLVESTSADGVETLLLADPRIATVTSEVVVTAQAEPDDPQFDDQDNLSQVSAADAWEETTGATSVVVGVIDSGIELSHPDLYLNVWINQGEIPAALAGQLTDVDDDALITFYDLNHSSNLGLVDELPDDGNDYIDAVDILNDVTWPNGVDTDGNGFVDDFFGWNFRTDADEPYAPNNPSDSVGHGTHVAGVIGATGDNNEGVAGVNWETSLMSLKFLDESLQGTISDAVRALNYATMMRLDFDVNLRVTNNSWGQSGGFSQDLYDAIAESGDAGILFVAAAGNGNVLGQGIDLENSPFYPASYDLPNILSVAAARGDGTLADFSNFGADSVDLAAPGVGILSTVLDDPNDLGDGYATANGTSMAAPHVAGAAALAWSFAPRASLEEVTQAILQGVGDPSLLDGEVTTGGVLDLSEVLSYPGFAPQAELVTGPVVAPGMPSFTFVVKYVDPNGALDPSSLDTNDVVIQRLWGPKETLTPSSASLGPADADGSIEVTYTVDLAPLGGEWNALAFGDYAISVVADEVVNQAGTAAPAGLISPSDGIENPFSVQITPDDGTAVYVNTLADTPDSGPFDGVPMDADGNVSLRAAIQHANETGGDFTIFLEAGVYELAVAGADEDLAATGDLDITGSITILGDDATNTIIDANNLDRVFHVLAGASLELQRVGVTGGLIADDPLSTVAQGGGVFASGGLTLIDVDVFGNRVAAATDGISAIGGGLAVAPGGMATITGTNIWDNSADNTEEPDRSYGGGIAAGDAAIDLRSSSVYHNTASGGGGVFTYGDIDAGLSGSLSLENVTISGNTADSVGGGLLLGNNAILTHVSVVNNILLNDNRDTAVGAGLAAYVNLMEAPFTVDVSESLVISHALSSEVEVFTLDDWELPLAQIGYPLFDDFIALHSSILLKMDSLTPDGVTDNGIVFSGGDVADVVDPQLANNGGRTLTHALVDGSPALDAATGSTATVDQRGEARPFDADGDGVGDPDIGAYEAVDATVSGVVFFDLDGDGVRDANEAGIAGRKVFADYDRDGTHDADEPFTYSLADDPLTLAVSELGQYTLTGIAPTDTSGGDLVSLTISAELPDDWQATQQTPQGVSIATDDQLSGAIDPGADGAIDINGDGRFIVYVSGASDIVEDDTNAADDVFLYDRLTKHTTLISSGISPGSGDGAIEASISHDGRYIAFTYDTGSVGLYLYDRANPPAGSQTPVTSTSEGISGIDVASSGAIAFSSTDSFGVSDASTGENVFVHDGVIELISDGAADGTASSNPSISDDGTRVAFASTSALAGSADANGETDVYYRDRSTSSTFLVSIATDNNAGDEGSILPAISGDGMWISFASAADNLVATPSVQTEQQHVYVRSLGTGVTSLASTNTVNGGPPDGASGRSSMSYDGAYVVYESNGTNVTDDAVASASVYIHETDANGGAGDNRLLFTSPDLNLANTSVAISGNGEGILLAIDEPLIDADQNPSGDAYFQLNPFFTQTSASDYSTLLLAGQTANGVEFGSQPRPGEISGVVYSDDNQNGVLDAGEAGFENVTVLLDSNGDGIFNDDEAETDENGAYSFPDLAAGVTYQVIVDPPDGQAVVFPDPQDAGVWVVALGAQEAATGVDFGLQPDDQGGQSDTEVIITGTVFDDVNGNGFQDPGESGLPGYTVYYDQNGNGEREFNTQGSDNEPGAESQADGSYVISGSGLGDGQVRIDGVANGVLVNPIGNEFLESQDLATTESIQPGDLRDLVVTDLNGDDLPDIIAALEKSDQVVVYLGAASGDYGSPITIDVSNSPQAIAVGQFNGPGTGLDVAVTRANGQNIRLLMDFDGSSFTMGPSNDNIVLGQTGLGAVEVIDVDKDGFDDLVVANTDANEVWLLKNNGAGDFTLAQSLDSGGLGISALVVGDFNGDEYNDLAIANYSNTAGDAGRIRIYLNALDGGFTSSPAANRLTGLGAVSLVAGDFLDDAGAADDGAIDLAVASFESNTVTILRGEGNGSFQDATDLAVAPGPTDLSIIDIENDGDLDLVATNLTILDDSGEVTIPVSVLRNQQANGEEGFASVEVLAQLRYAFASDDTAIGDDSLPTYHAFGDINGDGLEDLFITDSGGNRFAVQVNNRVNGGHQIALAPGGGDQQFPGNNFALAVDAPDLPGDYNLDGVVDSLDYGVWRSDYGASGAGLAADGNDDGIVDAADYAVWRNNLGATAASALAAPVAAEPLPEPTPSESVAAQVVSSTSDNADSSFDSRPAETVPRIAAPTEPPTVGAAQEDPATLHDLPASVAPSNAAEARRARSGVARRPLEPEHSGEVADDAARDRALEQLLSEFGPHNWRRVTAGLQS